ncbi:uncharacterized protein TNIN_59481 [Trichonephila inaurata madagascariensis]|uniref:Uncharacterized protein n=1 Tax=Trichonephila inaurata madagascariensis TaxID=2747483 RepID=A0A8X6WN05_9ARAC|nr:uncharacterized protein TNIN_59481 [Trichonephila inaurata madagascariensis]
MSHSNPAQVGEIFTAAGAAFNKLAELIMNMHAANELTSTRAESTEAKDLCLPQKISHDEVENISELLKNMKRDQVKTPVMVKKMESATVAGMKKSSHGTMKPALDENKKAFNIAMAQSTPKPYITLNMLNAVEHDQEVDISIANKLDYDSTDAA